jgi:hypothetical protein
MVALAGGYDAHALPIFDNSIWALVFVIEPPVQLADALCKQAWRLAAVASPDGSVLEAIWRSPKARWLYLLGVLLLLFATALETVANNLAPAAVTSSLGGALAIVWLILLSPCLLGERMTLVRLGCAAVMISGTALVGVFAPRTEVAYTGAQYLELCARPPAIIYYIGLGSLFAVVGSYAVRTQSRLLLAVFAGLMVSRLT